MSRVRQQLLLELLAAQGRIRIKDVAKQFHVSVDTVRRDLEALAQQGTLYKTHGGAISLAVAKMRRDDRASIATTAKHQIGRFAAAQLTPGQTVMLDAGQTVLEVARHLPVGPFKVITHALDIATYLLDRPGVDVIVIGGTWDAHQRIFAGAMSAREVARYRADVAILGACAIHERLGVTASSALDANIKRAMIRFSERRLLVADHTKFDNHEPYAVADLDAFDIVVTDRDQDMAARFQQIKVVDQGEQIIRYGGSTT